MNAPLNAEWISELASWAAHVSMEAVVPAVIVLLVSRSRLIPAKWCAILAVILLVRLIIPFSIPVSWRSPVPTLSPSSIEAAVPVDFEMSGQAPEGNALLPWVWALGAGSVLSWLLFSQGVLRRRISEGQPAEPRLQNLLNECVVKEGINSVPTPVSVRGLETVAVFGWWEPRLLIPHGLADRHDDAELRGILRHELQHLKRHDALWTWLGLVACAVHWFNPLVWLLFRRFTADRELACDEAALKSMRSEDRRTYGEALIKTAERICFSPPALLPSFSAHPTELKYRMTLIMKPQNRSIPLQLASVAFAIGITTFAFTSARADSEKPRVSEEGKKSAETADGQREGKGARDGEGERKGPRDGEGEKKGPRDSEGEKKGPRDGEGKKPGMRDGEGKKAEKEGDREGGSTKEGGERMSKKETPSEPSSAQQLVIQIDADGNVINSRGDVIPIDKVRGRMSQFAADNPDRKVILRGDPATPYEKVLKVIDALRDVGLKDVQLQGAQK